MRGWLHDRTRAAPIAVAALAVAMTIEVMVPSAAVAGAVGIAPEPDDGDEVGAGLEAADGFDAAPVWVHEPGTVVPGIVRAGFVTVARQGAPHPRGVVPVDHRRRRRPLAVEVWTDRGHRAVYRPGETLRIRFRSSDDAYVCVYNIDTEGRVRVLFPDHPGDLGFVPGGRTVVLPEGHSGYDLVVSGPPGIEQLHVIASRRPLNDPWHGRGDRGHGDEDDWEDGEDWEDWDDWEGWEDGAAEGPRGAWYELDPTDDDWVDEAGYEHRAGSWAVHGLLVTGDPFMTVHRVNRRLLPAGAGDWDYATDYTTFYVERRYRYPRYVCADCHGSGHHYDPYQDHCSIFSIRVNTGWHWVPRHVRIVHHDPSPRYLYVRHKHVPRRYRSVKRTWPSSERRVLRERFRRRLAASHRSGRLPKSTRSERKDRDTDKSTRGYRWKTGRSRGDVTGYRGRPKHEGSTHKRSRDRISPDRSSKSKGSKSKGSESKGSKSKGSKGKGSKSKQGRGANSKGSRGTDARHR